MTEITLELDLIQILPGLVLTALGILLYIVSPPTTTDKSDKYRHSILGLIAFVLLFLVGTTATTPAGAFAFFSAGVTPSLVLDLYQESQKVAS